MKPPVLLSLLLLCESALALPLTGRVVVAGRGSAVNVPTIVYAEALDGRTPIQAGQFTLTQKNKAFSPHILAVPVGSTVVFPNDDLIFHNVFSLSRPGGFDLGLYRNGDSKSQKFTAPTTLKVFCNIHPQMAAVILVLPTSYIAEADSSGNYRFDLPPGRYRITAWSERAQAQSNVEITVGSSAASAGDLSLDESRFQDVRHKNKLGQDYPKSAYENKKP